MNPPDNIFIYNYNGNDTCGNQWHSKSSSSSTVKSHEYIRKDALLEWAKEKRNALLNALEKEEDDASLWGQWKVFLQLIDKLNTMSKL